MSEGYIIGGGGSSLNFKVIAVSSELLLPATAKENTIAVITTTPITSYVFSSSAPTSPTEGMVWLVTGTASTVEFNAIKKNGLWVYPTGCQQYVSGAWVQKTVKTYMSGAWQDWQTYLYSYGDQHTDITGGWTTDGVVYSASNVYTNGGISFTNTAIRMTRQNVRGNIPAVSTVNKVDLSEFETLKVNFDLSVGGTQFRIYISSAKNPYDSTAVAHQYFDSSIGNDQTATLDVSGVNTSAYIVLCSYSGNEYVAFTQDIKSVALGE